MAAENLTIALMGLGRDQAFLAECLHKLRALVAPSTQLVALIDEVQFPLPEALTRAASLLVTAPRRSGFARARRRSLLAAASLPGDGILVCDGDGQFSPETIAAMAVAWEGGTNVLLPQRLGTVLPGAGSVSAAQRTALEALENRCLAELLGQPTWATKDLQPGAFVFPTTWALSLAAAIQAQDFGWELECMSELLPRASTVQWFPVSVASQDATTFVAADGSAKFGMLARRFGKDKLGAWLQAQEKTLELQRLLPYVTAVL